MVCPPARSTLNAARFAPRRRFFAEHATVDQFRAINDIRATWVNQLAQQCVDGDQGAETQLEGFFEVQVGSRPPASLFAMHCPTSRTASPDRGGTPLLSVLSHRRRKS